ncbi:glycoside hydrolase family 19 protein [Burkholderia diffusa]|uniref:glycoside hydrolase family 19 protein n=1 Tax=Burkholderia diffusa TaxID=488732 RepID=UPI002ABE5FE3|nr:glycoside hydrolase family 19 protein [Burkholderia diffusa]
MTTQPAPKKPQAPTPAPAKLKSLPFAFPFLRKGQGQSKASAQFTDEHEIYRLLAEHEPAGTYLVGRKGMWHGGIHITEAGAGQSLDLEAGLRCIADGVLIAYRADKTYPLSEIAAIGSESPDQAPYSTGFALVRHTMEFPRGRKLTFYSLYMHLMSYEDYANFPKRDKPSYWPRQWRVTQYAQDKPSSGRNGQVPDSAQQGLRVRKTPNGTPIGILPQGATVGIGKIETKHGKRWGQLTNLHGTSLYPQEAGGYVEPSSAIDQWVYLGQENGGPVVEETIQDSIFDRVIVVTDQTKPGDTPGIPIKAGELVGHLGRYDSLNQRTSGTRMAHIEVFCDDSIQSFLEQGRTWVNEHGAHKEDWAALGLPSEPTILRIAPGTVLYQRTQNNKFVPGADPQSRKTDAVQVYSLAELARDPKRRIPEPHPNPNPGYPVNWWHVDGVNAQGQPIDGWVCDFNHASGRVTREFAQKWIDFECIEDTHDPAHTIFATTPKWVDCERGANVADIASPSNLSPLMLKVYDTLFTRGDGKRAANELCTLAQAGRGGYPWLMQAASRLIVKHESEWANPSKWTQLIAELEKHTGSKPQHGEEQKRIEALAWWDKVKAGTPGFPGPDVYHVNPIGLVGNFKCNCNCINVDVFLQTYEEQHVSFESGTQPLDATSKENLRVLIQGILDYYERYKNKECNIPYIAYMLGTARLETKKYHKDVKKFIYFEPTTEGGGESYFNKYDPILADTKKRRQRAKDNGNTEQGDGYTYRGRGYVQVTWKNNYRAIGEQIGVDLVHEPDRMLEPEIAAWATVYGMERGIFTGKKLSDYVNADAQDYVNARRIINGLDQADAIASFAIRFKSILEAVKC